MFSVGTFTLGGRHFPRKIGCLNDENVSYIAHRVGTSVAILTLNRCGQLQIHAPVRRTERFNDQRDINEISAALGRFVI
jgi:hypothetical protein